MGRKRKKVVKSVRRKLPSQYLCPNCGKNAISISLHKEENFSRIICANCSLREQFPTPPLIDPIDAYCLFVDKYYGVEEQTIQ
jgi:transcription elongation factor Elf1